MEAVKSASKRHQTKYGVAFRVEAVRHVIQNEQATTRVAQALGTREAVLNKWMRAART